MRLYNIAANLIRVIGNFYRPCHQCSLPQSQRKRRSESDTKGRLLSPTLFNMLLKRITNDALEDHKGTVSIGDRTITEQLPMTWMTLAGNEEELASLMDRLDKDLYCLWHGSSAEKTKLMTNSTDGISVDIRVSGEKLDEVNTFKYLGALVRDQESKPEALSRMALTTSAPSKLKRTFWNDKNTSLSSKIVLYLLVSVLLSCMPVNPGN